MNREIKFRAYDKLNKELIEPEYVHFDKFVNTPHQFILLQYTGLTDKNGTGVELYEGDIVQRRDGEKGEVIWHQESCGFAIAFGDDEPLGSLSCWFEVVGNIHWVHFRGQRQAITTAKDNMKGLK